LQKLEQRIKENEEKYSELVAHENQDLNENLSEIDCLICLEDGIQPHQGVVLKECLHSFCKYDYTKLYYLYRKFIYFTLKENAYAIILTTMMTLK